MKKIFVLLVSFLLLSTTMALAGGFIPRYGDSVKYFGIGVYFAPKNIKIYAQPNIKSNPVSFFQWNEFGVSQNNEELSSRNLFLAFDAEKEIALMAVTDETEGWYEVVYNQQTGDKGWINDTQPTHFLSWLDFMMSFGRNNKIYLFSDLPEEYRILRTSPEEGSQALKSTNYSPENIKLIYIRGNWMLVRALDYAK